MRCALLLLLAGCVDLAPPEIAAEPIAGEVAVARITRGDCISVIADRLSFPGGWRALARFNGLDGELIRDGAGLRVPVGYLRAAGIDPYGQMGLEHLPPRVAPRALVPCPTDVTRGDCAALGDATVCLEATPPTAADDDNPIDLPDGALAWPGRPGRALVLDRGGVKRIVATLPNDDAGGDEGGFEAHRIDLDGDRRDELVVAVPIGIRNHMGWEFSRVIVIGDAGTTELDVAEWGEGSLVAADAGRCDLIATSWEGLAHPLDGEGMYLVGRPLHYERGALIPAGGEVVRRMRSYFHVADDAPVPPQPAAWLAAPAGEWWSELGPDEPARATHAGTVIAATASEGGVALDVELASGQRIYLAPDIPEYDPDPARWNLTRLGWAETSTLFPEAYRPADPSRWRGAEVLVTDDSSQDDWDATGPDVERYLAHTVWLRPR